MLVDSNAPEADSAVELAELFCSGARRRVDRYFHDLWQNDDEENYEAAQRVLKGRYTWVEEGVIDPASLVPPLMTTDHPDEPAAESAGGGPEG